MPRKLKVYYDLAIAAPSMKAALEAWGANMNLFHQGVARETDDGEIVAAAMDKPGVVLQRPVGSNKPFKEHAELPTAASLDLKPRKIEAPKKKEKAPKVRKTDVSRSAGRPQHSRRSVQGVRGSAKRKRPLRLKPARSGTPQWKAEAALAEAKQKHEESAEEIAKDLAATQRRADAEEERWQKLKDRLEEDLRKASRF